MVVFVSNLLLPLNGFMYAVPVCQRGASSLWLARPWGISFPSLPTSSSPPARGVPPILCFRILVVVMAGMALIVTVCPHGVHDGKCYDVLSLCMKVRRVYRSKLNHSISLCRHPRRAPRTSGSRPYLLRGLAGSLRVLSGDFTEAFLRASYAFEQWA